MRDELGPLAAAEPDLTSLLLSGSGPMLVLEWGLIAAAAFVCFAIVVKARQVARWRRATEKFEHDVAGASDWETTLRRCETDRDAIGAPVLAALLHSVDAPEVLEAVAEREVEHQHQRVYGLMTALSSIGVVAPLAGLFGTVYGIIHAFLSIGTTQSASLTTVAPAIGEALLTTATGLVAAIPAVIGYNVLAKRLEDLLAGVEAAGKVWAGRVRASIRRGDS